MKARITTPLCFVCLKTGVIEIDATDEQRDELFSPSRRNIQHIFPELSVDIREQMISGTHPECWDKL